MTNLKRIIDNKGVQQRWLAEQVGVTEVSMSRYVSGDRILKAPLAIRMADALGVDVRDLYGWDDEHVVGEPEQPETHDKRTETHSCDCIERQAALDWLKNEWNGRIASLFDGIKAFPSAQPEPCGDVVSRNAIVQKLNEMDRYVSTELRLCDTDKKFPQNEVFIVDDVYEEIVEQLPSAQPQRTGRWIYGEDNPGTGRDGWFCSKCGHFEMWDYSADMKSAELNLPNFCPNCGARMEGK